MLHTLLVHAGFVIHFPGYYRTLGGLLGHQLAVYF